MCFRLFHGLSPVMAFLFCFFASSLTQAEIREYWIAAEKTSWNYAPGGKNLINASDDMDVWGETLIYQKYRYVGYVDHEFGKAVSQPEWMGILGPQIRAEVGDTIKVHF